MGALRRRLVWLAGLWLCGQFAALTMTATFVCATASHAGSTAECACVHGSDPYCPMHDHSAPSKRDCSCRSNSVDPATAAVLALLGHAGLPASAPDFVANQMASRLTLDSPAAVAGWIGAPDGPPPRLTF